MVGSTLTRKSTELPADVEFDPSVLRQAAFGDVELGHDLDTCRDGVGQVPRRRDHLVQHAVGPNPDLEFILERLEMDVAGLVLDRQQQHHVEQFADRGGRGDFLVRGQVEGAVFARLRVETRLLELVDDLLDAVFLVGIVAFDGLLDVVQVRDGSPHVVAEEVSQVVERRHVLRIGHGDRQHVVLQRDRHDLVDVGHRLRDDLQHIGGDVRLRQADDRHAPLLGQGLRHLDLGHQAHANGDLADDLTGGLLLFLENIPELILGEIAEVDEDLA